MWRGGLGWAYLLAGPFVCRCLNSPAVLRFHIPLIEPDVRFSRIRLSDKNSCFRTQEAASKLFQLDQSQRLVQVFIRKA